MYMHSCRHGRSNHIKQPPHPHTHPPTPHRGQIPLIYITDHLEKTLFRETQAGNFAFWLIFCVLGQPMAVRVFFSVSLSLSFELLGCVLRCNYHNREP